MMQKIKDRFQPVLAEFLGSVPITLLTSGKMEIAEYRAILRQVFHHARENPQLQALATVYFRGRQRDMIRGFYRHAVSEIGHDQLALNDFITLGGDAERVPYENPLPATSALLGFGFYQVYNLNPLGYLGYLFFLEFMPTQTGEGMMTHLRNIGVPDSAQTFLKDHAEIDQGHNRMMEKYVEKLVQNEADLDAVLYAMKTTGYLYERMFAQAIESVHTSIDTGWNWQELDADNLTPDSFKRAVA